MPKQIDCPRCNRVMPHYAKEMCKSCYTTTWMQKDPAKHARQEQERRDNHPDKVRAQDRKRNESEKRKQWKKAYQQTYYEQHRDELLEYQQRYRRADPERTSNYKRRRMARVLNLPDTLTVAQWKHILDQYNHACAYCGIAGVPLEREHRVPAVRGGGFTAENIVPACGRCNRRKKTMTEEEFRAYILEYP